MKTNTPLTSPERVRTSVAISGIDRSTPDDIVKDGACSTLHNMRYNAEAWRPMHQHKARAVTLSNGNAVSGSRFEILYNHPADNDDVYIARRTLRQGNDRSKYIICRYNVSDNTHTDIATFNLLPKVSHFGNVLMFNIGDKTDYYILEGSMYKEVSSNLPLPTITISQSNWTRYDLGYRYFSVNKEFHWSTNTPLSPKNLYLESSYPLSDLITKIKNHSTGAEFEVTTYQNLYNIDQETTIPTKRDGKIWGNLCFIVAYKMDDGSIIQVSPMHLAVRDSNLRKYNISKVTRGDIRESTGMTQSNTGASDKCMWVVSNPVPISKTTNSTLTDNSPEFCPIYHRNISLRINIPESVTNESSLVSSITIYSTRLSAPFDILKYRDIKENNTEGVPLSKIFNSSDLLDSPFYLLKEYLKTEISDNTINLDITPEMLEDMLTNEIYSPTGLNSLTASVSYDYNNRLHIGSPIVDYLASPHLSISNWFSAGGASSSFKPRRIGVSIGLNGLTKYLCPTQFTERGEMLSPYSQIISIPDTSVKSFLSQIQGSPVVTLPCSYSYGNGYAYYVKPPTNEYQFPVIDLQSGAGTIDASLIQSEPIQQPNRLQVSESNNCFSFPYTLSYRVGSENNRILAMQSAAIKIGDEQVGALPLYVFTEEGIYALRAGESTLYAAVNPINHDRIINPSTISINGAVAYITEKGVHILTGEGSKVISTPIHNADGIPDIDFLKSCVFLAPKQFNEIVLLNSRGTNTKTHYVYNLDYGYWSTRELDGTKINTDELVDNTNGVIYDLNDEDESTHLPCSIVTRPIKLGNVEYKRLETIIPRLSVGEYDCVSDFVLDASDDGKTYRNALSDDERHLGYGFISPLVYRRIPYSAKYYRVTFNLYYYEGEDGFAPSITHIDFEWYRRFGRRMR